MVDRAALLVLVAAWVVKAYMGSIGVISGNTCGSGDATVSHGGGGVGCGICLVAFLWFRISTILLTLWQS